MLFAKSVIKFLILLRIIINVHTVKAETGRYYAGKSLGLRKSLLTKLESVHIIHAEVKKLLP